MKGKRYYYRSTRTIFFIFDIIILNLCYLLGKEIARDFTNDIANELLLLVISNTTWILLIISLKTYELKNTFQRSTVLKETYQAIILHLLIISTVMFLTGKFDVERTHFIISYASLLIILPIGRIVLLQVIIARRRKKF